MPDVRHFKDASAFRTWLEKNHETATELYVGYWNKATGKGGMTYIEAVDTALCFGWIDGLMGKHHPQASYNRYTPRKPKSTWSLRNIGRVKELTKQGLMTEAGLKAFKARTKDNSGIYGFENKHKAILPPAMEKALKANKKAWTFFSGRPQWYQRSAIWWVVSAKREETKASRLQTLINDSAAGRTIKLLTRKSGRDKKK